VLPRPSGALLLCVIAGFSAGIQAQTVETIDALTGQWLAIESQIRTLRSQWQLDRPLLEQRIRLLDAEREQLTALLEETRSRSDSVADRRSELLQRQNELEGEEARIGGVVDALAARLADAQPALAPAIATAIPTAEPGVDVAASTARLQRFAARIERLQQFNERFGQHRGVIELDGQSLMADQLYLGLSYAWFVTRDDRRAGHGRVVDGQWHWWLDPDLDGEQVRNALEILNNRALPDYVSLPVVLAAPSSPPSRKTPTR